MKFEVFDLWITFIIGVNVGYIGRGHCDVWVVLALVLCSVSLTGRVMMAAARARKDAP